VRLSRLALLLAKRGRVELGPKPACSLPLAAGAAGHVPAHDFAQTLLGFRQGPSLIPLGSSAVQGTPQPPKGAINGGRATSRTGAWYEELETCWRSNVGPGLGSPARASTLCKPWGGDHASAGGFQPLLSLAGIASSAAEKESEGPRLQRAWHRSAKPSAA